MIKQNYSRKEGDSVKKISVFIEPGLDIPNYIKINGDNYTKVGKQELGDPEKGDYTLVKQSKAELDKAATAEAKSLISSFEEGDPLLEYDVDHWKEEFLRVLKSTGKLTKFK